MEQLPELQAAMRQIAGVAAASVRWPDPSGSATLHVTFDATADADGVASAVLEAMERIAGVPAAELGLNSASATAGGVRGSDVADDSNGTSGGGAAVRATRAERPVFTGLLVERDDLDSHVTVTLDYAGRAYRASAQGLATRRSTPKIAASAALLALRELLPSGVRMQLDWLEVVEATGPERPDVVHAAVTCLTAAGEETHLGTAMVRGDLREAAVRATLDALNRRLQRQSPALS